MFDEYFQFHERIDKQIHLIMDIQETAITDQLDGAIVLLYFILAIGVVIVYWKVIKRYQISLKLLVAAFIFLFLMIVLDLLHTDFYFDNGYFEEASKLISEYFFLLAFVCVVDVKSNRITAREDFYTYQ